MTLPEHLQNFQQLLDIMARLRADDGCPWDQKQTPETLKKHILEEACELIEAIDSGNTDEICDELGDLLLQVVFQAQIFSESGQFGMAEVASVISEKLIRRHPHVFSNASQEGHEQRWEEIKTKERAAQGKVFNLAQRLPASLPALHRATKLAKKFPAGTTAQQLQEMQAACQSMAVHLDSDENYQTDLSASLADLLFAVCSFAAAEGLDPEDLLRRKTMQRIVEIESKKETP